MSEATPWTTDRDELDADVASRAIAEALPELADADVKRLGNGWDFDAFLLGGRYVFRFPRREQCQEWLQRDLALLPWITERLDFPMPRYCWGALRAPSFPYAFSGYEMLPGEMAASIEPERRLVEALGTSLGAFFRKLHALEPPAPVVAAGALDRPLVEPALVRDHMRRYLPTFSAQVPYLADRAALFFDGRAPAAAPYTGPPRLIHADLHAEHLLLDPSNPFEITGLIDWSDARVDDPARDFACIYSWGGETILSAMCAAYRSDDPTLESRARFLGTCFAFMDLAWWTEVGRSIAVRAAIETLDHVLPRLRAS